MTRPSKAIIHTAALRHNLQQIRHITGHSPAVLAMVKADAYGHGLAKVANALAETDAFGVSCLEEALWLHDTGARKPIVLMEGFYSPSELPVIFENGFEIVIHHLEQIEILEKHPPEKPVTIWLKIDTGMNRLGVHFDEAPKLWKRLNHFSWVKKPIRLMTHFANAFSLNTPHTHHQIEVFEKAVGQLSGPKSLANSAGILAWPETYADWVRPGIILYGVSPFVGKCGLDHGLRPAMSLYSALIAIRDCQQGETVGYGGKWRCPEAMRIGVVAIGYGDGYPLHAKSGTPVLVNGRLAPLVGRVSMDMIMVDLRGHQKVKVGDPVLLWGEGLPIEKVAASADTIAYELLCQLTGRVHRVIAD